PIFQPKTDLRAGGHWAFLAGLVLFFPAGFGQGAPVSAKATSGAVFSTNESFKALAPGLFALGLVRLDQRERTVSFPASINMREGIIEYLLVTSTGKTH